MKKKLLFVGLGVMVGLVLGIVYGQMRLGSQEKECQLKIKQTNQRMGQAQRRLVRENDEQRESLEAEKAALQAEVDKLEKERQAALAETKALKARVATSEDKAASLEEKNRKLTDRLVKAETDGKALDDKQRQAIKTLQNKVQDREKDLKQIAADWKLLKEKYDKCADANSRLYEIGEELIKRYEGKGVVSKLIEKEPFTQIKRVELEKTAQEYRDRISQQKIGVKQ